MNERSSPKPYPQALRAKAAALFEAGYGYKATATKLGVPQATVRDWKRLWVKRQGLRVPIPYDEMLRSLMLVRGERYVSSSTRARLLEAYWLTVGRPYDSTQAMARILEALRRSPHFKKTSLKVHSENRSEWHEVYKLVH
ncbi:helix-turn-helix domain-containing protein [Sutterella sp.]|uniref:helix-turn-helix domain-containing protein n=1 Tax=Sutterella sp. TaxID=1981025 RepID=UPI003FD74A89